MMSHDMGRHYTIPVEIAKGLFKYGPRIISAEQRILRGVGYSHKSAKGISHGLFAGAVVGNIINLEGSQSGDDEVPFKDGTKANPQDKARGGLQRYSSKKYKSSRYSNYNRRCSCARKYSRSRNR